MVDVKLDVLAKELFNKLNNDSNDIFKTKIVIVPSMKMEAYLKSYFLKNEIDILMNVQFLSFNKAILELFNDDFKLCSKQQIRSLIIKYLINNNVLELKDYINVNNKETYSINLYDVSDKIASAFEEYDNNLDDPIDYQITIYNYVMNEIKNNKLTTPRILSDIKEDNKIDAYAFGFIKYTNLQNKLLNKFNIIEKFDLNYNNELIDINKFNTIIKAPSKIREIEALHTDICKKLISDKKNRLSDFLVVCGNLSEYEVEINRVFNQEYKNYPSIPFFIDAPKIINNSTNKLLNLLIDISNKGFYTRRDVSDILDNWIIRKKYYLLDEDIDNLIKAVIDSNVYRKDDWKYIKRRLLISKISDINDDNIIELSNDNYLPFYSIGLNDNNISSFINIIDNLDSFINMYNSNLDIDLIKNELEKWFSIKEYNVEKNSYFNKMVDILDFWKNENITSSINVLFYNLSDICSQSRNNKGFLYTSGITFEQFSSNLVLSAKYIYFIGASSENLPLAKQKNPFDLINKDINYDDEDIAFKLYCLNTNNNIYISYVNKNLKENQEQYFLSSLVKKLYKNKEDIKYYNMPLDEKRDYEDLFTKRSMDNKEFRNNLVSDNPDITNQNDNPNNEILVEVTTGDMAKFLSEPLSYKANKLFGKDDDTEDDLNDEYEPFDVDNIDNAWIIKEMVINELLDIPNNNLYERLLLENKLPNISKNISKKIFDEKLQIAEEIVKTVKDYNYDYQIIKKLKDVDDNRIITLADKEFNGWKLVNNQDIISIKDLSNNQLIYIPIKQKDKIYSSNVLNAYVIALREVLDLGGDYNISIYGSKENYNFEINSSKALELLEKIYKEMNDYNNDDNKFFDSDLLDDDSFNKIREHLYSLTGKFKGEHKDYWKYFDSANLFDLFKQLGYGDNYSTEIEAMRNKMADLIIFK